MNLHTARVRSESANKRRSVLFFALLLTTAFAIRWFYIWSIPITIDEKKLIEEVRGMAWSSVPVQFVGHGTGEYIMLGVITKIISAVGGAPPLFASRLTVLVSNLIFIVLLFHLARRLFSESVAWTSALFSVLWPWSIIAGTISFGAYVMLPFATGAILMLLRYVDDGKILYAYPAFFLLACTFYSYPSSILWTPFILLAFAAAFGRRFVTRHTVSGLLMMIILITPIVIFYLKNQFGLLDVDRFLFFTIPDLAGSRFNDVSIFDGRSPILISANYFGNYLSHFYFPLLHTGFFSGQLHFNWLDFFWDSIFLYIATFRLYKEWPSYRFVAFWLALYPLGTSLTSASEGISFTRDIMALPLLLMLSAFGAVTLFSAAMPQAHRIVRSVYAKLSHS